MKVTDILAQNKDKTLVSFEILPPLKGKSIDSISQDTGPSDGIPASFYRCDLSQRGI